jgi:hypothetical protein
MAVGFSKDQPRAHAEGEPTVKLTEHIWDDGNGNLVRHGDPSAAFLRYTRGEEFNDHEWATTGLQALFAEPDDEDLTSEPPPVVKRGARPADKQGERPADK